MSLCVFTPLFHTLQLEMADYPNVTPQGLRDVGANLVSRLARTANIADRLASTGWTMYLECCYIVFRPPEDLTELEIEDRLRKLGIPMKNLLIDDDEDEIVFDDADRVSASDLG
jgi:hypothetical protein